MSLPADPQNPAPQGPPQYAQPPQYAAPPQYAQPPQYAAPPQYGAQSQYAGAAHYAAPVALSPKSWLATLLLAIFLGELGIDRFYLGKVGTGILKLITLGGFGLWWLIDIILIIAGAAKDKRGLLVKYQG